MASSSMLPDTQEWIPLTLSQARHDGGLQIAAPLPHEPESTGGCLKGLVSNSLHPLHRHAVHGSPPVAGDPLDGVALHGQYAAVGERVLQPLGRGEAAVAELPVEAQRDAQAACARSMRAHALSVCRPGMRSASGMRVRSAHPTACTQKIPREDS